MSTTCPVSSIFHRIIRSFGARGSSQLHGVDITARFSSTYTLERRRQRLIHASEQEKFQNNLWQDTELADPDRPIYAPQVLGELGIDAVDFLKIDIDGADFRVLNSFEGLFDKLGILGARLEVCMPGGTSDVDNTFHNSDRFMRRQGYELVRLDNRIYSMRALPARFAITAPAQTVSGRIFLAEAHYARDPAAANNKTMADSLTTEQILKLAAIFSAWDLPDSAAELVLAFRDRIAPLLDVDAALDVLAAQTQVGDDDPLPYRDYMALFAADSPRFYPSPPKPADPPWQPPPRPTLTQRLRAAWHSVSDWTYIEKLEKDLKERRR